MDRSIVVALATAAWMLGCSGGSPGGGGPDAAPQAEAGGADRASPDSASPPDSSPVDAGSKDTAAGDSAPAPDAPADAVADAAVDAPTTLDLHDAILFDNPPGLADWPVTTLLTDVEFQYMGSDGVHVEFSKQDGAGSWPDVTPPGWTGSLEYTLGFAENIGGQWYASAAIQFWRGLASSGGNVAEDTVSLAQCTAFGAGSSCQVAKNWYYDGRWGNLAGYQPATGEVIGVFVVAGNVRGVTDGSQSPVQERSNVVLVPMPDFSGAKHTF